MCLLLKMSNWSFTPRAWTGTLRSRVHARMTPTMMNGTQMYPAFWYQTSLSTPFFTSTKRCEAPMIEIPTIQGTTNCTRLTPKLPMPACRPRAVPCLALGKKYDVEGMNPEKAPPPMPASAARNSSIAYGVSGFCTASPHPIAGRTSSAEVIVTSLRVPMIGGRKVQIRRSVPPARPGMATSQ